MALNLIADVKLLWVRLQPWLWPSRAIQIESANEHGFVQQEYLRRLRRCEKRLATTTCWHRYLCVCLASVAGAACLAGYLALISHSISLSWFIFPVLTAPIVIRLLVRNAHDHGRVQRTIRFDIGGIARLRGEWRGQGVQGEEFKEQARSHLYAGDLDLFGRGSLFELLCTARTGVGRATLARWLLQPSQDEEILARHEAIRELRDKLELQEYWASVGTGFLDDVNSTSLQGWARASSTDFPIIVRVCALVLPVCLAMILALAVLGILTANWMLGAVLAFEAILAGLYLRKTRTIAADIIRPSFELSLLSPLMECIESGDFQSSLLKGIQSQLTRLPTPPSLQIRTLVRLAWLMDLRRNDLAIFLAPLLAGTNLAIQIEDWRRRNQTELSEWLYALGQFEGLLCLARHHYENPDWVFPTLRSQTTALFRSQSLGHPLLDSRTRVPFDLELGGMSEQLVIVSGSNMSGKSTLLRSVGTNAVLALAGSPVCAKRLEISSLCIACSISVHDSLRDDKSRFQAEVERLKEALDAARARNTLFLLDEMLGGTNSRDRLYGAQAVIKELMRAGAVGIVTTHDLALTEIANQFDERIRNVHFEEHYVDGQMRFDYKMLSGVLTRTNGINVMAALGLLPSSEDPHATVPDDASPCDR